MGTKEMWRRLQLAAATLLLFPHAAAADDAAVTTVVGSSSIDLGALTRGTTPGPFRTAAHGGLTPTGGDFVRLRGGMVAPQEVSISCRSRDLDHAACSSYRSVLVTVVSGGASSWPGRAGVFDID